ncbi:MAG: phosphate uptake regulator PhoU, partial [Paracoccaceae bacterium]
GRDALNAIGEMSAGVQDMLTEVLIAYEAGNIDLAAEIRDRDHEIDTLNNRVLAQATAAIRENPGDVETLVQMIILGRNFERAGDHVVNIARQVHQIVTGQDPKQWD